MAAAAAGRITRHLGFWDWKYLPANRGFASAFGYLTGAEDYWLHTNGKSCKGLDLTAATPGSGKPHFAAQPQLNGTYSTVMYQAQVQAILRAHPPTQPLFFYMPFQSVRAINLRLFVCPPAILRFVYVIPPLYLPFTYTGTRAHPSPAGVHQQIQQQLCQLQHRPAHLRGHGVCARHRGWQRDRNAAIYRALGTHLADLFDG